MSQNYLFIFTNILHFVIEVYIVNWTLVNAPVLELSELPTIELNEANHFTDV